MKTKISVFAISFLMAAVLMVSCDKDETNTSLNVNLLKKATVKGYLYAQLDLTAEGLEKAPSGTRVIITVPYSYFNSGASGSYKDTVVINDQGYFEVEIPVGSSSANVTFTALPFEANQVQEFDYTVSPVMKFYTASATTLSLSPSDYQIIQITYTTNSYSDFVPMAQISGILRAETNDTIAGSEATRDGIGLTFYCDGWNEAVTTTAGGAYSVSVPANTVIYVEYSFTAQHVVYDFGTFEYVKVLYLYDSNALNIGSFSPTIYTDEDIEVAPGEPVE